MARIQVNPVQYNPLNKTLRIYKTLKIQVTFPGAISRVQARRETSLLEKLNNSLFLNSAQFENASPESNLKKYAPKNDWYNPQYTYYKLSIDKEGVYALDYNELANAGIPVQSLDLGRLKIFNRGEEIPIRIEGQQGATFDPGNIIYFYGASILCGVACLLYFATNIQIGILLYSGLALLFLVALGHLNCFDFLNNKVTYKKSGDVHLQEHAD